MSSALGFLSRLQKLIWPPRPPKDADAVKFGILGAPGVAEIILINAARSHPGVVIEGVAARDIKKANAFAKKNGIPRVFGSYQELLNDLSIDAVYIPLANGFHYEWTMKALKAGKHVLIEKPAAHTSDEATKMFALAKEKNLVLLEGFHYRFHPVTQMLKSIIDSGTIGKVKSVEADMALPSIIAPNPRSLPDWTIGGGSIMDLGTYCISLSRYILAADPTSITHTILTPYPSSPHLDLNMRALLSFPSDITASISSSYAQPPIWGFIPSIPTFSVRVHGEEGTVELNNFNSPSFYHSITISEKKGDGGEKGKGVEVVKAYDFKGLDESAKGEEWWTTYRFQLEAFVDKIKGRTPQTWIDEEETVANIKVTERIYDQSGLGVRPASKYVP